MPNTTSSNSDWDRLSVAQQQNQIFGPAQPMGMPAHGPALPPAMPAVGPLGPAAQVAAMEIDKPPQDLQAALNPEEALRQLRMERARQHYERAFGNYHRAGASMASQGQQNDIAALLERINQARKTGWRPGRA